ncbi:MAG TPA: 4Fe-4S dicluster domain-containing protein [Desulfobacteria bacterium]|nr:4Fe-4S dicluster domain-containing protein [Desulfobacteria bacterium]
MKAIAKAKLNTLLDAIAKESNLLVPVSGDGTSKFAPYTQGAQLSFDGRTLLPPKDVFFPQTEKMYKFKTNGMNASVETALEAPRLQVLFGIRPCDAKSIHCLDHVFLTKGYVDEFYKAKKDATLIVSIGCNGPAQPTCFCKSMGVNPQEAEGVDVHLYDLGTDYGVVAKTEKGEKLFLDKYASFFTETTAQVPALADFPLEVNVDGITEKLEKMFDHPLWEEVAKKCLGCGACTYLCPTCHCFDISARVAGDQGFRFRCWDSCMFSEYTRMSAGNPRPSKKERVRNRMLHKLQYFKERYGDLLCTGCGRCLSKCPVNMDITKIIKQVREADLA